jgi:biotin carboxyl carrier protein
MKSYTITVNGTAYEVTVEENGNAAAPVAAAPKAAAPAPKAAPAAAPKAAAPKAAAPAAGAGSVKVSAAVPGKVVKIVASVGQSVKAGDSVVIVESMKMEIPVVAPQDGTIASIDVAEGAAVENGDTLATMN